MTQNRCVAYLFRRCTTRKLSPSLVVEEQVWLYRHLISQQEQLGFIPGFSLSSFSRHYYPAYPTGLESKTKIVLKLVTQP